MKREFTYILGLVLFCGISLSNTAQISQGGTPYSFNHNIAFENRESNIVLNKPDMAAINAEDIVNDQKSNPYRVGKNIAVNLNPINAGNWKTTSNGDKVWKLTIEVPDALALGFYYNAFEIPVGGEVFIYNKNKSHVIGAFTSESIEEIGATQMIAGDVVTIEYHAGNDVMKMPNIEIYEVAYFYRGVEEFVSPFSENGVLGEKAQSCEVDVACAPERNGNEDQINAVIHYTFTQSGSTFSCSASMLNNTAQDNTPYVLSAWHCGEPNAGTTLSGWVWYWKYQKITCAPGAGNQVFQGKGNKTMAGGTVRASSGSGTLNNPPGSNQLAGSDFYLVELQSTPPNSYDAFYAGWDRTNIPSTSGVGIHHPDGDAKKISTYSIVLLSSTFNGGASNAHWSVLWSGTTNGYGVTEGGSSGSPIFNENGRVVGQLSGGSSFCNNTNGRDLYGKFYTNWDLCGSSSGAQLKPWLDPSNTGASSIDGIYKPGTSASIQEKPNMSNFTIYPNPNAGLFDINLDMKQLSDVKIEIINALGQIIKTVEIENVQNSNYTFDIKEHNAGVYFIKVISNDAISIERFIKN
jgi:hypothetical protein